MAPTLAAGPLLGARCVNFGAERWGPFSSGFGVGAWAPQPPRNQPRGNVPAPSGLVGDPRLRPYVLRPYALGPPHRLQAYLFGVRRSLSARPYLCRLTLSGCHAWVCLGISPALMVPRSSAFHSVFSATHGRKANTKGTVTPLWMYKKLEKKKKKAICKAFLGCFSRIFKLFLGIRKNRAFKALLNCPGWVDNGI